MSEPVHTQRVTKVRMEELYPVIREILEADSAFSLTVTGTSMVPTLLGGRDQVTIRRPDRPLGKYDLPLYRRNNGQFILHRIVSVSSDGTYTCCGDHQWKREPGIRSEQIIGVVSAFCRKGKEYSVESRSYRAWVRFWVAVLPCRRFFLLAYHGFGRLKRLLIRGRKLDT